MLYCQFDFLYLSLNREKFEYNRREIVGDFLPLGHFNISRSRAPKEFYFGLLRQSIHLVILPKAILFPGI